MKNILKIQYIETSAEIYLSTSLLSTAMAQWRYL